MWLVNLARAVIRAIEEYLLDIEWLQRGEWPSDE